MLYLDEMEVNVAESQPCSVPVKVGPDDLLHPEDPRVKVDALPDVADHQSDVVGLAPVGGHVLEAGIGREVGLTCFNWNCKK